MSTCISYDVSGVQHKEGWLAWLGWAGPSFLFSLAQDEKRDGVYVCIVPSPHIVECTLLCQGKAGDENG